MSVFHYLQLQEVEPEDANSALDYFERDEMNLDDAIDGDALDASWASIVESSDSDSQVAYTRYYVELTDQQFDALITRAMDELPQEYIKGLKNVVIVMADEPTEEQRQKMKLGTHSLLLGLYEGVPLTQRGSGWSGMLPDKITLFKNQILAVTHDEESLFEQIKRTLWHEIAHYYGLDHDRIDELESRPQKLLEFLT